MSTVQELEKEIRQKDKIIKELEEISNLYQQLKKDKAKGLYINLCMSKRQLEKEILELKDELSEHNKVLEEVTENLKQYKISGFTDDKGTGL